MKFRCLIVDDEPLAINVIKKHLSQLENYEIVGTAESAIEAYNILNDHKVDLIFLDINMTGLNGIDFIKTLEVKPSIIMTTAYREYAVESFELDVIDYLVKPIAFPRFMKALNKFNKLASLTNTEDSGDGEGDYIFLKVDKKMIRVPLDQILYIESLKDYVRVKTVYEELITHHNLSSITALLPGNKFFRIHKSYTIAIDKVKTLEGNTVEVGGKKLPIGRNYQKEIRQEILKKAI